MQLNGNQLTTQGFVQMDSALANSTDYDSLTLAWQISPDNGTNWILPTYLFPASVQTAGNVSRDPIFVTLANPNGWNGAANTQKPTVPWTVFFVGTEGGFGAFNNATLLTNVWEAFTTLHVTNENGAPMQYWGGWATQNATTAQLISGRNGQCYAWTALFQDVLTAWGDTDVITQKRIDTKPNNTVVGPTQVIAPQGGNYPTEFLVGSWNIGAAAPIPNIPRGNTDAKDLLGGYTNYAVIPNGAIPTNPEWIGLVGGQPGYLWANGPVPPNVPTPAQNNINPRADFENHAVVLIDGVLYDPSYGVTYAYSANNPLGGFAAGLGGFMAIVPFNNNKYNFNLNGAGANSNTSYWVALFKPITAAMVQLH